MFLLILLLGRRSFSVSLPLCLVIGRTFAGWACFCTLGCSVGTPLAFPCLFASLFPHFCRLYMFRFWLLSRSSYSLSLPFCLLIGRRFANCACFCYFGCLVGTPLCFRCLFAFLLAPRLPVGTVFVILVAW